LAAQVGGIVFPELLELLLEEVGSDSPQVEAEQIAQADLLFAREILWVFEQAPAGFLQHRLVAGLRHSAVFRRPHLI